MIDPAEHTIAEIRDYLAEHPEDLEAIIEAEEAGKGRVGVINLERSEESNGRNLGWPLQPGEAPPG